MFKKRSLSTLATILLSFIFIFAPVFTIIGGFRLVHGAGPYAYFYVAIVGLFLSFAVNIPMISSLLLEQEDPQKKNRKIILATELLNAFSVMMLSLLAFLDMSVNPFMAGLEWILIGILNIGMTVTAVCLQSKQP